MNDGQIHERISLVISITVGLCGLAIAMLQCPALGIGLFVGSVGGFFIDPDLDHRGTTHSEYRMYKFGKISGALFSIYWTPYQAMFKHGSEWSHGGPGILGWAVMALVATPIRILYSLLWTIPCLIWWASFRTYFVSIPWDFWLGLYLAWAVVDFGHWCRDYIFDRR